MLQKSPFLKSSSMIVATTMLATSLLPTSLAQAESRRFDYGISGPTQFQAQRAHRKHARRNHKHRRPSYSQPRVHTKHVNKRRSRGDLIAAGVIGLALGAVIASQAAKNRKPAYQPSYQPQYQPDYQYGYSSGNQPEHVPNNSYDGPDVITFNEAATLEPWSPGWQQWCQNRYRSFNANTGTYRGYDGLDHFCVPK